MSDNRFYFVRPAFSIGKAVLVNVPEEKLLDAIRTAITLSPTCECSVIEIPAIDSPDPEGTERRDG